MLPTIVFFFALVFSVTSVYKFIETIYREINSWIPFIYLLLGCMNWSWLFYLLH